MMSRGLSEVWRQELGTLPRGDHQSRHEAGAESQSRHGQREDAAYCRECWKKPGVHREWDVCLRDAYADIAILESQTYIALCGRGLWMGAGELMMFMAAGHLK